MEGNEWGVEERGGERFNKPCLGVFLSEREKDLRGLEGVRYPSKASILIPPIWGHLEGEGREVVPLILK